MIPAPLTPTNLIAVGVPKGARDFIQEGPDLISYMVGRKEHIIHDRAGNWKFIGLATKDTIDFDAHLYVSPHFNGLFTNYEQEDENASDAFVEMPEDSFRSLLQANGCYLENPFGAEPPKYNVSKGDGSVTRYLLWKEAQSKVSECWAILEKV